MAARLQRLSLGQRHGRGLGDVPARLQRYPPRMRLRTLLLAVMMLPLQLLSPGLGAAELTSLSVVVVSDAPSPGRGEAYADWLRPLVASVRVVHYGPGEVLAPALLAGDVVLLDWDPAALVDDGDAARDSAAWIALAAHATMPLGPRSAWRTPTVLLGAAGLLAAEAWHVAGAPGSASLQPFAYELRAHHPVSAGPVRFAADATIELKTPAAFVAELSSARISVLPLVPGGLSPRWPSGWCSDTDGLSTMPDVECISGGLNQRSATAMAIWRQGDLLHVGFRQRPMELNAAGRALLANAIAYIADLHGDRPIAIQGDAAGHGQIPTRATLHRLLRQQAAEGAFTPALLAWFAPAEQAVLAPLVHDAPGLARYCRERLPYLHPETTSGHLVLDSELQSRSIPYDAPAFLDLVLAALHADPETGYVLLQRYVPEFPKDHASVAQSAWVAAHRSALFPSDVGGYRWYVDPLAQARGVPSASLHGPARRDQAAGAAAAKP